MIFTILAQMELICNFCDISAHRRYGCGIIGRAISAYNFNLCMIVKLSGSSYRMENRKTIFNDDYKPKLVSQNTSL